MDTAIEQPQNIDILPNLKPQHEAFIMLRENGVCKSKASQMVGFNRGYANKLDDKVSKYLVSKDNKLLKLAHSNLKNMLQPDSPVKDSVRLGCITTVLDRHDPVIRQNVNLNISCDISPVDLDKYRNR